MRMKIIEKTVKKEVIKESANTPKRFRRDSLKEGAHREIRDRMRNNRSNANDRTRGKRTFEECDFVVNRRPFPKTEAFNDERTTPKRIKRIRHIWRGL